MSKKNRPVGAIVLAAGLGTRMRSARAKVLHELVGEPLISYPLRILRALDVDPIVVVVGHQEEEVRAVCAAYDVRFARQKEQRGTGHAARMAAPTFGDFQGDVLLVNGDLPLLRAESVAELIGAHRGRRAAVSLLTAEVSDPKGFGRILRRDPDGDVLGIVEEKDATSTQRELREVNVGLYCSEAEFLFPALKRLRPNNVQGEYYLTDVIAMAAQSGRPIGAARAQPEEGTQISTRADLATVGAMLRHRINSAWMVDGVSLEDPATTSIGPNVTLGREAVIGSNVTLLGRTAIGAGSRLDGTCRLVDVTVGEGVHLKLGVVASDAVIGDGCVIGPFAQLRPGTRLGRRVHVGNFVETKNAVIGDGTKANHLAYLGDAEIGTETNIGAGTITCNYDGFRKHRTTIGDRVQVGSDSQLIAPVRIADDAYISTGSTVRRDVGAGELFFNPKPEVSRAGWVAARRKRERDAATPQRSSRRRKGS